MRMANLSTIRRNLSLSAEAAEACTCFKKQAFLKVSILAASQSADCSWFATILKLSRNIMRKCMEKQKLAHRQCQFRTLTHVISTIKNLYYSDRLQASLRSS